MPGPSGVPMPIEPHRPQRAPGLCAACGPAPPRWRQAIGHEGPTGAFEAPRANRPATRPGRIRTPSGSVPTLGAPRPQPAHGHALPRPSRAPRFARGPWAGRRLQAIGRRPQGPPDRLRRARIRSHRGEAGADGLRRRAARLPLAQAHGRRLGGRRHHGAPWAIRWHAPARPTGRGCGRRSGRRLAGRDLRPRLCDRGRAGGFVRRAIDRPLPPQVGGAGRWHAQLGVAGARAPPAPGP